MEPVVLVGTEVVLVPGTERVLVFPTNVVWAVCPELGLVEMVLVSPIGVELVWGVEEVLSVCTERVLLWTMPLVDTVLAVCTELVLASPIGVELVWVWRVVLPFPVAGELVWEIEGVLLVCTTFVMVWGLEVLLAMCMEVVPGVELVTVSLGVLGRVACVVGQPSGT